MGVKDLVELYELPSDTSSRRIDPKKSRSSVASRSQPNAVNDVHSNLNLSAALDHTSVPPSPARFIHKDRKLERSRPRLSDHVVSPGNLEYVQLPTYDITDVNNNGELLPIPALHSSYNSNSRNADYPTTIESGDDLKPLIEHRYPPNVPDIPPIHDTIKRRLGAVLRKGGKLQLQNPIPAAAVFARYAPMLYLPELDEYIASLPPSYADEDTKVPPTMFPPMDRLARTGLTLDDLELNSKPLPFWRNRSTILGSVVNVLLGFLGSSAFASFYSLQGLLNTVQVFALILSTIVPVNGRNVQDKWRRLFLGTVPNVLALNFASTLVQSLIFLITFMIIAAGLLYYFYRNTRHCDRYNEVEGLQEVETKGKQWGLVIVTFLLTVIYLPLSTMAIRVLVWSQDMWAVQNPYTDASTFPPEIPPLGPTNEFRDPLDFCWTTTMKRNEVNFALAIIFLSIIVLLFLSIWFPFALRKVIKQSVPKVDKYSEIGRARNRVDLDAEYHRLLSRDQNPFAFLYSAFRRGFGTYESVYLFAKLSTLVIVSVIDSDNCLFRNQSRKTVPVVRQILLLLSMIGFFIAQCLFTPFLDPVNNASEWTSRLNYVMTSITALLIALNVPGKDIIGTYVLYTIYIVTYGLSFYFSTINLGVMQRLVKRLTRRIDFSIDIFSPRLDISPTSIHTKRRIWQESVTALLLTDSNCKIPKEQFISFAQSRDSEFPPYLLGFRGTPGERHIENLKILREIGSAAYNRAVALTSGPDHDLYRYLGDEIQKNYIGPDCYWKGENEMSVARCKNFFGNAWWIPFPPTLVIRYDDGPLAVVQDISNLQAYLRQNSSADIRRRRYVRVSLRALEGQTIAWPYEYVKPVGSTTPVFWKKRRYKASTSVHYRKCVLHIKRQGYLKWDGIHLGSGFGIELWYSKKVRVSGQIVGLNDDFDLTPPLARFLELNGDAIHRRIHLIEEKIASYRQHVRSDCVRKSNVLTYRFLSHVYDRPRNPDGLAQSSIINERDLRVRELMLNGEAVFAASYRRLAGVAQSEVNTWWYIFWDDLWRRNHDTISGLQRHATDFNPHYTTSIAYRPLSRVALEGFLMQRGLLHSHARWNDFFHSGFLNKLYLRLNDTVFRDTHQAVMFRVDGNSKDLGMDDVDEMTQGGSSTLGTGGGTDHDDLWIHARPAYRWEGLLGNTPNNLGWSEERTVTGRLRARKKAWMSKLGAWFGISPLWREGLHLRSISLEVRLEDGKYVLVK